MQRIVLRHISGSKANQVEEFPLNHVNELIFGRDPAATVKYDPDRDDLVGRQHAKLAPDPSDPTQFVLTDLNSRNGTFLNRQRIVGSTKLAPGDHIQFGAGGPEVQFDLEPRPQNSIRPTRAVALDAMAPTISGTSAIPQTRAINLEASAAPAANSATPRPTGTVGKATVERMISQNIAVTKRTERRKYALFGGGALVVVLLIFAAVAGYVLLRSKSAETQLGQIQKDTASAAAAAPLDPTAIANANRNTVVKIDVSWKLISPQGGLVYHQYGCDGKPCFVELQDGSVEPLLSYDKERFGDTSPAIGGKFTASGFVVTTDGFIMTNRHVAAAWQTPYNFPPEITYVTVIGYGGRPNSVRNIKTDPIRWIPSETKQIIYTKRGKENIKEGEFNGQNERLDVFFPGRTERNVATYKKSHEDYDLALIKVDLPGNLKKAELYDGSGEIKQGYAVYVMGYQFASIPTYGIKETATTSRAPQQREITDPNGIAGTISRLIGGQDSPKSSRKVVSEIGDAFQLAVGSPDAGYDGSPVFDNRGRVIGVFTLERRLEVPTPIAIPGRYALELAGSQ